MDINKPLINQLGGALEAYAHGLKDFDETVDVLLEIYQAAANRGANENIEVKSKAPAMDLIIACVASYYSVAPHLIMRDRRTRGTVEPRQVAMYLGCELTGLKLQAIGRAFDGTSKVNGLGKDHSTVIYSRDTVIDLMETDKRFKLKVMAIRKKIIQQHLKNNPIFEAADNPASS